MWKFVQIQLHGSEVIVVRALDPAHELRRSQRLAPWGIPQRAKADRDCRCEFRFPELGPNHEILEHIGQRPAKAVLGGVLPGVPEDDRQVRPHLHRDDEIITIFRKRCRRPVAEPSGRLMLCRLARFSPWSDPPPQALRAHHVRHGTRDCHFAAERRTRKITRKDGSDRSAESGLYAAIATPPGWRA